MFKNNLADRDADDDSEIFHTVALQSEVESRLSSAARKWKRLCKLRCVLIDLLVIHRNLTSSSFFSENLKVLVKLYCDKYPRNGVAFLRVNEVKFSLKPGQIKVRFDNLFNGQKDLENVANEVINQNINLITEDLFPQIEKALERKTMTIANQFFEKAPASEFFPQ